MKFPVAPLLGSLFCATALTLSAQTFTEDNSGTPGLNTFSRVDGFPLGEVIFNNTQGGSIPNPYSIDPVGITVTEITSSGGTVTVYDICAEMFIGPNESSSYSVSEGFGSLSAAQQVQVAKLFSNTLIDFVTLLDGGDRTNAGIVGAAIQLAFWEIAEDPLASLNPSLDDDDALAGELSIAGFNTDYTGDVRASINLAEVYLASLDSWGDNGGLNYYSADPGSEQGRLWVSIEAIPEPSTALLGLFGFGLLLRRKRN